MGWLKNPLVMAMLDDPRGHRPGFGDHLATMEAPVRGRGRYPDPLPAPAQQFPFPCATGKPQPCPSDRRRRDRIDLGLFRSWDGGGRPENGGVWTAKTVKRPPQQPARPPIRRLLGAADAQTAHPPTSSTGPAHQRRGSANAETTPAGAPAAAADRKQRPDATREGKNG